MQTPSRGEVRLPGRTELRELYRDHRGDLVRLASLLLHDPGEAEEIVQDAFVKAYVAWDKLREREKALPYLRSIVLNGARSRLRHMSVVAGAKHPKPGLSESPEVAAVAADDQRRTIAALRSLPYRQRECLALRYFLDLPEAEIAATLGISVGSVKTHTHRGLAALATRLEALR
jgi:RNA polymerase sigma-70 factor (sigma-E family)